MERILEGRDTERIGNAEAGRNLPDERHCVADVVAPLRCGIGEQLLIEPQRLPVGPPNNRNLPTRERFARIPLALAVVDHAAGGE